MKKIRKKQNKIRKYSKGGADKEMKVIVNILGLQLFGRSTCTNKKKSIAPCKCQWWKGINDQELWFLEIMELHLFSVENMEGQIAMSSWPFLWRGPTDRIKRRGSQKWDNAGTLY